MERDADITTTVELVPLLELQERLKLVDEFEVRVRESRLENREWSPNANELATLLLLPLDYLRLLPRHVSTADAPILFGNIESLVSDCRLAPKVSTDIC